MWAFIGLVLTVGGTFFRAFITNPPWEWGSVGLVAIALGVTYQVGAVLLVSCLGGERAGVISQIAFLVLGLAWYPVFAAGGGLDYLREPTFGYLLGFVPGAWLCGRLAGPPRLSRLRQLTDQPVAVQLERLAWGCLCGLLVIHTVGLVYLGGAYGLGVVGSETLVLKEAILRYTVYALPGQLAIACAVSLLAFVLRRFVLFE
jgi:biotin transport system substrate-specific component